MEQEIIRQDYLDRLWKSKDIDLIKVITGMRRSGKTIIMRQFIRMLEEKGIPKSRILYIDMDSLTNDEFKGGHKVYSEALSHSGQGKVYILIDEVQNIDGWMNIVESLRNDIDCDIYLTGSNAYMLSSDIATLLTGRSITITVLPLSFKEYCTVYGDNGYQAAFLRY